MQTTITYRSKCKALAGQNLEEKIISQYLCGNSILAISKQFSCSDTAIRKILIGNNIPLKTKKEIRNSQQYADKFSLSRTKILKKEEIDDVIQRYASFESPEIIAAAYNVTPRTIRCLLKKHNIKLRNSAESAQLEIVKRRKIDANLAARGVENPLQDRDIFNKAMKSGYRFKSFEYNGVLFENIQGFEDIGIRYTVDVLGYDCNEIQAGRSKLMPTISYFFRGKVKVYFPDIYVPKDNLLLEIKSRYIFERCIEKNLAKQQASKDAGFDHKILIFSNDGKDIDQII